MSSTNMEPIVRTFYQRKIRGISPQSIANEGEKDDNVHGLDVIDGLAQLLRPKLLGMTITRET